MSDTSAGGVAIALFLVILGLAALAGGGYIVSETTFAEQEQRSESYGPLGVFGQSSSGERTVNLEPVLGFVLVAGGLAGTIAGIQMAHASFEQGKDREIQRDS